MSPAGVAIGNTLKKSMGWEVTPSWSVLQGDPSYQEDRVQFEHLGQGHMIGVVCDGHGGHTCSEYVHKAVIRHAKRRWPRSAQQLHELVVDVAYEWDLKCAESLGIDEFPRSAEERKHIFERDPAVTEAYEENGYMSGCTLNCFVVDLSKRDVVIHAANVGDSRFMFWNPNWPIDVHYQSDDHKPKKSDMGPAGGIIKDGRYNEDLAVGRAIGDNSDTLMGTVRSAPDIYTFRMPARRKDQEYHMISCTDGVWDVVTKASSRTLKGMVVGSSKELNSQWTPAEHVTNWALERGSGDNISCLHVHFKRVDKK